MGVCFNMFDPRKLFRSKVFGNGFETAIGGGLSNEKNRRL